MQIKMEEITHRLFQAARQFLQEDVWDCIEAHLVGDLEREQIVRLAMLDKDSLHGCFDYVTITGEVWHRVCGLVKHYALMNKKEDDEHKPAPSKPKPKMDKPKSKKAKTSF